MPIEVVYGFAQLKEVPLANHELENYQMLRKTQLFMHVIVLNKELDDHFP